MRRMDNGNGNNNNQDGNTGHENAYDTKSGYYSRMGSAGTRPKTNNLMVDDTQADAAPAPGPESEAPKENPETAD